MMKAMIRTLLGITLATLWTGTLDADETGSAMRVWRDQTGKFEVEAELLDFKQGRVKLRKADGRIIYPPLSLLSSEDQAYVSKWEESQQVGNIFAGGVMEDDSADQAAADQPSSESGSGRPLPPWRVGSKPLVFPPGDRLIVQPMKRPQSMKPISPAVPESRDDERIIMVPTIKGYPSESPAMLIDDKTRRSFFRIQSGHWDKEKFTQAVVVDPGTNRAKPTTRWDEKLIFVNSHAPSGRVIARAKPGSWSATGELAVFSSSSTGEFRELVRWKPSSDNPNSSPEVVKCYFINDHLVSARVGDVVHCWDLAERRGVWQLGVSGWSRGGRTLDNQYLAAQARNQIAIFEMATGRQVGAIALPNSDNVDVAFSPSGRKVAAVGGWYIRVFDLSDPSKDSVTQLTRKIDTYHSDPVWVDEDHLLVENKLLVDPQLGQLIWQYEVGSRPTVRSTFQTGLMRGTIAGQGGIAVFALALPHDSVLEKKQATNFNDSIRIDHGASVRIEMKVTDTTDSTKVSNYLTKAIEKAGWKIDNSAPNTIRFVNYRTTEIKRKYGSGRFKGQELPFRPYASYLEITANGNPVYRLVDPGRAPDNMEIELNETLAQAIERQTVPSYRLLERLELPGRIVAPEFQQGLGKSKLTAGGFVDDNEFRSALPELPPREDVLRPIASPAAGDLTSVMSPRRQRIIRD